MRHQMIESGRLRAYIDGGLSAEESEEIRVHLADCAPCRSRCEQVREAAQRVQSCFGAEQELDDPTRTAMAWTKFRARLEEGSMSQGGRWFKGRLMPWILSGAAVAAMIVVVVMVAPVRVWAQQFLSLFRVQHIAVLDLDPASLPKNPDTPQFNQALGKALSDQVTVTEKPLQPVVVADGAAASKLTGFQVRLLANSAARKLSVENESAVQMKLNRDRLQSILDEAGRRDLQVPASVDGGTLAVRIPASIGVQYGDCSEQERQAASSAGRTAEACIRVMEMPSPVVSVPAGIDPAQIAEVMLEFIGMKPDEARAYTQTIDWTSTLVLPMLRGSSSYKKVIINGNEGLLIRLSRARRLNDFELIWVDEGILYGINGSGDDSYALDLASQLQ